MQASRILASWLATRGAMLLSARGLARRRERLWERLQPTLRRTPALAPQAGSRLEDMPVTEPADLRGDYGRWNSLGLPHEALHAAAEAAEAGGSGEVLPGIVAGYSTGGSGARGIFLASAAERSDYIGQSLARLVPLRALVRPCRIALFLRANSRLYSDVGSGRFSFAHFPLDQRLSDSVRALGDFRPTILVAPAHRLVEIASAIRSGTLSLGDLKQCFFGAEPMSEPERDWAAEALRLRPQPIYQATEGFLGAACRHGRLHLNEHSLAVELEPVAGTSGFRPIVTDLLRKSQPVVRVRLDDFLELEPRACPCGYAGRTILPVAGRVTDLWRYGNRVVRPRDVADRLDAMLGVPSAWQADASPARVVVKVDPASAAAFSPETASRLRERLGLTVAVEMRVEPVDLPWPKRRRVRWHEHD